MTDGHARGVTIDGLPLNRARDLAVQTATVAAACHAGVFRGLACDPASPTELAERLDLEPRAVGILLPVLRELDLLERDGERFGLTSDGRRCLADPEDPDFQAGGLPLWLENLGAYTRLPKVLAHGGPLPDHADDEEDADEEDLTRFMAAMAAAPDARIQRLVDRTVARLEPSDDDRPPDVLDLGGGPGHMARAFVDRGFRVTLFDRPDTVAYVADEYGLGQEPDIDLVGGDFVDDPLPPGPFDIVLMSNVVHIYEPDSNRRVLEKVAGVTRPDGVVAVADFLRGRSPRAARFALVMLLRTEEGDTYSADEITGWLREAGFGDPKVEELDEDRQLVTARREDDSTDGGAR